MHAIAPLRQAVAGDRGIPADPRDRPLDAAAPRHYRHAMPIDETRTFLPVRIAVLTVSDTRGLAEDRSGDTLVARLSDAGHVLADRAILRDDVDAIVAQLHRWIDDDMVDCIVTTGGTGVTGRDVTPEAVERVADKMIPGFGELFRWLSFQTIGTSTVQSRACACVARGTYIFALPGSTGAVKDAWDGILASQLDSRHRPCNFVELMPRLLER
jgi:molybdenum cofactor biosynthesis protein B